MPEWTITLYFEEDSAAGVGIKAPETSVTEIVEAEDLDGATEKAREILRGADIVDARNSTDTRRVLYPTRAVKRVDVRIRNSNPAVVAGAPLTPAERALRSMAARRAAGG
jgi:hypothetical protein